MKRKNLTGKVFGRWTVVAFAETRITPCGSRKAYWKCTCECGATNDVRAEHLMRGRSESCGCLQREVAAAKSYVHGGRDTALYGVWCGMIQRCENPNHKSFLRYGGRGISVCVRWNEFSSFLEDNKDDYEEGLTIDRIDNDGNYEPGNVRWVSIKKNCRNTSKSLYVDWMGERVALNDLADRYGIKTHTLYRRVRIRGIPLNQALGVSMNATQLKPLPMAYFNGEVPR